MGGDNSEIEKLRTRCTVHMYFQVIIPIVGFIVVMIIGFLYNILKRSKVGNEIILDFANVSGVDFGFLFKADIVIFSAFLILGITLELYLFQKHIVDDDRIRGKFLSSFCVCIVLFLLYVLAIFFETFSKGNVQAFVAFVIMVFVLAGAVYWTGGAKALMLDQAEQADEYLRKQTNGS